jgi:hypothetical protein
MSALTLAAYEDPAYTNSHSTEITYLGNNTKLPSIATDYTLSEGNQSMNKKCISFY